MNWAAVTAHFLCQSLGNVRGERTQRAYEVHLDQGHSARHTLLEAKEVYFCLLEVSLREVSRGELSSAWSNDSVVKTYMRLQIINAYVDTLDHVEEVSLQDERLSRMVEHARSLLKFLEVLQPLINRDRHVQQSVLHRHVKSGTTTVIMSRGGGEETHPFLEQQLASVFQALATFFHRPPSSQHVRHFPVNLIYPLDQPVTCFQVVRHALQMCAYVRFLAVCHRAVDE